MTRKRYDRDRALSTAMDVFWLRGYEGASMRDLCEATGLNSKSVYAEFGNKATLFREALALYTRAGVAQSRAVLEAEPHGIENVRRYFLGMRYGAACRGCLMTMTINERALVPEDCITLVADAIYVIEALIRANLTSAGLDADTVERLATFLVFSIQGITTMGKLEGDEARLRRTVETLVSVLDAAERGTSVDR